MRVNAPGLGCGEDWGKKVTNQWLNHPEFGHTRAMGLLPKLFRLDRRQESGRSTHEVEVRFAYGSTNFQHVYALEDQLRIALSDARAGESDGHELAADGSEGRLFFYGPDAENIFRVLSPLLSASPLMGGATVILFYGPRKWRTAKRVIELPE